MDKDTRKNTRTTYDFTCGDNSTGTVTTKSPDEARQHAQADCAEKNGVQSGPEARPWAGHQE